MCHSLRLTDPRVSYELLLFTIVAMEFELDRSLLASAWFWIPRPFYPHEANKQCPEGHFHFQSVLM